MSYLFHQTGPEVHAVLRQSAKHQLDSYADEWLVAFEALQNAMDAVEKSNNEHKKVKLVLDPARNMVEVWDSGIGFPADPTLFGMGKGTKHDEDDPNIRGEHGVGIKMVIICTSYFELITRVDNRLWQATYRNACQFLTEGEEEDFQYISDEGQLGAYSTVVRYKFSDPSDELLRPLSVRTFVLQLFSNYREIEPFEPFSRSRGSLTRLYVEHYFRTHSYTGDANRLFDDREPVRINVTIKRDSVLEEEKRSSLYPAYLLKDWKESRAESEIEFPAKYWDPTEAYKKPTQKGFLTEQNYPYFVRGTIHGDRSVWVLKITDKNVLKRLTQNELMRSPHDRGAFDDFVDQRLHGLYAVIGSLSRSGRYNLRSLMLQSADQVIAADGVITTNQVRTPKRGRNQNYLNNMHIVLNIRDRVNYGKQGVKNPWLLSQLYNYFEEIYVMNLVDLAKSIVGREAGPLPPPRPEVSVVELNDLGIDRLSVRKEPIKENTLIALLYDLIGRGVIEGIQTYQLSSAAQYDGQANLLLPGRDNFAEIERDSDLQSIEFKINLQDLISDVEQDIKSLEHLHLIVVWNDELGTSTGQYSLIEVEDSSYQGLNISGVYHVLKRIRDGAEAPVLSLRRVIEGMR